MEENLLLECPSCQKPLPQKLIYFCGNCLSQIRCKSCDTILEKDYAGCTNCGTPKENRNTILSDGEKGVNTFRFHETKTERMIEASFSDNVGKEVTDILRDAANVSRLKAINNPPNYLNSLIDEKSESFSSIEIVDEPNSHINSQGEDEKQTNLAVEDEFPAMRYIVMNNLPSSEAEWIIVYAFYCSKFGKEVFTRKDILKMYGESGRRTDIRVSNLSSSITSAVRSKYFIPINNQDFSIVEKGIEKAKEIIARTSGSAKVRVPSKSRKDNASDEIKETGKKKATIGHKPKVLANIDFYPTGKKSLVDFISEYNPKNDNERNLLFIYYMSKILGIEEIGLDHLFTCYDAINQKLPENMIASLNNTKVRKKWLGSDKSNIELTTKGLNEIKSWDSKQKDN